MNRTYWQELREDLIREGEHFGMHIDSAHCTELREQIDQLLASAPHRSVDASRADVPSGEARGLMLPNDYETLRNALGVDVMTSFDRCIELVREARSGASDTTSEDDMLGELNERLRLARNAALAAATAQSGPAISHWHDKIDEHERGIRDLFARLRRPLRPTLRNVRGAEMSIGYIALAILIVLILILHRP